MCQFDSRHWCLVIICCLLVASSGCRNRAPCGVGCYSGGQSNGLFAGATTIAPPATYSLNIPGGPNAAGVNTGVIANAQAPVRQATNTLQNGNSQNGNSQNGWRAVGSASTSNSTSNSTIQNGAGQTIPVTNPAANETSVLQNPNPAQTQLTNIAPRNPISVATNQNNGLATQNNQVAQQNNGLSFTDATNFRSTAIDERLDGSRLPVTDASQVRAPTSFSPSTTIGQFNQPYYVPNQQLANAQQYPAGQRVAAVPQQFQQQIRTVPVAQTQPNTVVGAFGQPNFGQPTQQIYQGLSTQNPRVLAQSTVYSDPANDANLQNGWRDRELTAGRDSLNR